MRFFRAVAKQVSSLKLSIDASDRYQEYLVLMDTPPVGHWTRLRSHCPDWSRRKANRCDHWKANRALWRPKFQQYVVLEILGANLKVTLIETDI